MAIASLEGSALAFLKAIQHELDPRRHAELFKGANGVAAGVSGVIAAAYALTFLTLRQPFSALVAGSTACSSIGFLRYNWPAAKTFMGDSGSAALGFTLAFLSLSFWRSFPFTPAQGIFPLIVAALPLIDAALAILRRLRRGHSPLEGDRGHIYDLMLANGLRPKAVASICWGITAVFFAIGCYGMRSSSSAFWILAGAALFTLVAAELRLGSLRRGDASRKMLVAREELKALPKLGSGPV